MKRQLMMLILIFCVVSQKIKAQTFDFAFFTDMHIGNDSTLNLVKEHIKDSKSLVDFFLLGGDNVNIDNQSKATMPQAVERYRSLKDFFKQEQITFYPTIGNHDRLPKEISLQPDSLFVDLFGDTYYSYDHKGVKFIVLNSVQVVNQKYALSPQQILWLKDLLENTATNQPIVISTHVPFLSVYYPVLTGEYTDADTFSNQKAVFDLFENHNLKLVLQGHMHLYEEIKVKDVTFITAGAISGNWWQGSYHGTAPGGLIVKFNNGELTWKYNKL